MTDADDGYPCRGCGTAFDSEAARNGHEATCEQYDPEDMDSAATNDNTTEDTMSDSNDGINGDEQFKREMEAILPGKDTFDNLRVRRTAYAEYQAVSARNSGLTLHTVNLQEPSCSCEDWQYNREDGEREICAHFAAAFLDSEDITTKDMGVMTIVQAVRETRNARQELEEMMGMANGAAVESRAAQATAEQQRADSTPDPDELKEMLVDGLDSKGFNVDDARLDGEEIVFELGYYDGDFDDVREVTSECDLVGYNGDHNFIKVSDVQKYVEGVL